MRTKKRTKTLSIDASKLQHTEIIIIHPPTTYTEYTLDLFADFLIN